MRTSRYSATATITIIIAVRHHGIVSGVRHLVAVRHQQEDVPLPVDIHHAQLLDVVAHRPRRVPPVCLDRKIEGLRDLRLDQRHRPVTVQHRQIDPEPPKRAHASAPLACDPCRRPIRQLRAEAGRERVAQQHLVLRLQQLPREFVRLDPPGRSVPR